MDPLAVRVARRFIAGKRMAPTLQDYIHMVTEDGAKIAAWKRAFVGKSLQSAKAAHQKVVTEARQPGDQRWTERVVKDADNVNVECSGRDERELPQIRRTVDRIQRHLEPLLKRVGAAD